MSLGTLSRGLAKPPFPNVVDVVVVVVVVVATTAAAAAAAASTRYRLLPSAARLSPTACDAKKPRAPSLYVCYVLFLTGVREREAAAATDGGLLLLRLDSLALR